MLHKLQVLILAYAIALPSTILPLAAMQIMGQSALATDVGILTKRQLGLQG